MLVWSRFTIQLASHTGMEKSYFHGNKSPQKVSVFSHLLLLAPKICLCCLNVLISHFLNINQPTHSELHKELWHPIAARPSSPQLIEMSVDPDTVKSFPKNLWNPRGKSYKCITASRQPFKLQTNRGSGTPGIF